MPHGDEPKKYLHHSNHPNHLEETTDIPFAFAHGKPWQKKTLTEPLPLYQGGAIFQLTSPIQESGRMISPKKGICTISPRMNSGRWQDGSCTVAQA